MPSPLEAILAELKLIHRHLACVEALELCHMQTPSQGVEKLKTLEELVEAYHEEAA